MCLPFAHLISHMTTLCICVLQVYCRYRIVPEYDISCVTLSSIDCALQMLQITILGRILNKGPQDRHLLTLVIFNSDSVSMHSEAFLI